MVKTTVTDGIAFELRVVGEAFVTVNISTPTRPNPPRWDREQWLAGSMPAVIGVEWPRPTIRVLDMPIRCPGDSFYRLPLELLPAKRFIDTCFEHAARTQSVDDRYFYLTCDTTRVETNATQREPGIHVDGFHGLRSHSRRAVDYSYIAWNSVPTMFYPYRYDLRHLDFRRHDVFAEVKCQTRESAWSGIPGHNGCIYFMDDANSWHSSGVNRGRPIVRSFWRLSASERTFDRLGNTVNMAMDISWTMKRRSAPTGLVPFR